MTIILILLLLIIIIIVIIIVMTKISISISMIIGPVAEGPKVSGRRPGSWEGF